MPLLLDFSFFLLVMELQSGHCSTSIVLWSAIIISTQPLVILLMLRILEKKRIMLRSIIGVGFGIFGILLLVSQENLISSSKQWSGIFALFVCLLSWAYGSIFVSKAQLPKNHFVNGAYQMLLVGILLLIASHFLGESSIHVLDMSNHAIIALFYLIVFGSIIAFTSFNYLLVRISPEKVATSTYINPIIAIVCGWYFLDEIITLRSIVATFVLLVGVYFINTVKFHKESS